MASDFVFRTRSLISERVQKYSASAWPGQRKKLNTFNYPAAGRRPEAFDPMIRRMAEGVEGKKGEKGKKGNSFVTNARRRENVFFNPRPICDDKCYDGLTLTNGHCRIELER
jgi:hypothetical protein